MVDADKKWPGSVDVTQTAFNLAFKTDLPFFKYIGAEPERYRQFAGYMRALTSGQEVNLDHLVKGWDWDKLGHALVVDVSDLLFVIEYSTYNDRWVAQPAMPPLH